MTTPEDALLRDAKEAIGYRCPNGDIAASIMRALVARVEAAAQERDDAHAICLAETAALQALVEKWRAPAAEVNPSHATMGTGYPVCADELSAALRSARGPEQETT